MSSLNTPYVGCSFALLLYDNKHHFWFLRHCFLFFILLSFTFSTKNRFKCCCFTLGRVLTLGANWIRIQSFKEHLNNKMKMSHHADEILKGTSVKLFYFLSFIFLPDPGVSGVRSMGPGPGWDFADVTLADDDTNSILADDANRANWIWRLSLRWCWSGRLVWRCPMWAMRSPRGSARWCKSCREYWSCDHVGDNVCCWSIG